MHVLDPAVPQKKGNTQTVGDVWSETLVDPIEGDQRMVVGRVRFAPGSRTAWHSHARGQYLHVVTGVARIQSRGHEVIEIYAGQTVYTPPGEEHWHGAAPDSFMEHLAMLELGDDPGSSNVWLDNVTEREYHGE